MNKFSGDADAAGPGPYFESHCSRPSHSWDQTFSHCSHTEGACSPVFLLHAPHSQRFPRLYPSTLQISSPYHPFFLKEKPFHSHSRPTQGGHQTYFKLSLSAVSPSPERPSKADPSHWMMNSGRIYWRAACKSALGICVHRSLFCSSLTSSAKGEDTFHFISSYFVSHVDVRRECWGWLSLLQLYAARMGSSAPAER